MTRSEHRTHAQALDVEQVLAAPDPRSAHARAAERGLLDSNARAKTSPPEVLCCGGAQGLEQPGRRAKVGDGGRGDAGACKGRAACEIMVNKEGSRSICSKDVPAITTTRLASLIAIPTRTKPRSTSFGTSPKPPVSLCGCSVARLRDPDAEVEAGRGSRTVMVSYAGDSGDASDSARCGGRARTARAVSPVQHVVRAETE